jgi:hypothetical protein
MGQYLVGFAELFRAESSSGKLDAGQDLEQIRAQWDRGHGGGPCGFKVFMPGIQFCGVFWLLWPLLLLGVICE